MIPSRAAVYARISDDTEGRAAGVGRQIEDAEALALRQGWTLAPYPPFVDNDISASTRSRARRPAFEELLALVEAGKIDGIAHYSSSRLTRRPMEFETIVQLVERTGVALTSVASGNADLTTADGRMIARILAAQDAAEAERTGERVTRAFQQRRAEGKPNPSSRAFGFAAGGMEVVPGEAALILEAAVRIADEGWSLGEVRRDWNERKVPTVRGAGAWNATQIRRALLSPRSAGLVATGGVVLGPGSFEAILTPELQQRVAAALAGRRNGTSVTYQQRKHVLAGFMVCGKCGKPMKVNAMRNEDGSLRKDSFVVCSRSQYGCGGVKRNLPMLLEYIDGLVRLRLESWEPVADVGPVEDRAHELAELQQHLKEVEEDLTEIRATFEAGGIRFKDYNEALSTLRAQQEGAQRALTKLLAPVPTPDDLDVVAAWEGGVLEDQREVLRILIDHIKLLPMGRVGPAKARQMMPVTTEVVWA